jgi:hypothetical protein
MFHKADDRQGIAECLAALAGADCWDGSLWRAAQLFGAATALLEAIGSSFQPADRIEYNRNVGIASTRLDSTTFAAAWATGRAMTLEHAVDCALTQFCSLR